MSDLFVGQHDLLMQVLALMWVFIAREYGLITIENKKLIIDEEALGKNLYDLTLDIRIFLYTVSYFGSDKD